MPATSLPARRPAARPVRSLLAVLLAMVAILGAGGTFLASPASATTAFPASTALRFAMSALGKPYVYGATGPSSYDCSGFISAAYRAAGIRLPRTSRDQYTSGTKVSLSQLQPGDLLFWANDIHSPSTIHHVGIALSKWNVVHAPHSGTTVQVSPIWRSGLMPYAVRPGGAHAALLLKPWPTTSDGNAVIQQRLRANGYHLRYTARYDSATRAAVVSFQHRYGIPYDNSTVQWRTFSSLMAHGVTNHVS